jgi:hypothetical protein
MGKEGRERKERKAKMEFRDELTVHLQFSPSSMFVSNSSYRTDNSDRQCPGGLACLLKGTCEGIGCVEFVRSNRAIKPPFVRSPHSALVGAEWPGHFHFRFPSIAHPSPFSISLAAHLYCSIMSSHTQFGASSSSSSTPLPQRSAVFNEPYKGSSKPISKDDSTIELVLDMELLYYTLPYVFIYESPIVVSSLDQDLSLKVVFVGVADSILSIKEMSRFLDRMFSHDERSSRDSPESLREENFLGWSSIASVLKRPMTNDFKQSTDVSSTKKLVEHVCGMPISWSFVQQIIPDSTPLDLSSSCMQLHILRNRGLESSWFLADSKTLSRLRMGFSFHKYMTSMSLSSFIAFAPKNLSYVPDVEIKLVSGGKFTLPKAVVAPKDCSQDAQYVEAIRTISHPERRMDRVIPLLSFSSHRTVFDSLYLRTDSSYLLNDEVQRVLGANPNVVQYFLAEGRRIHVHCLNAASNRNLIIQDLQQHLDPRCAQEHFLFEEREMITYREQGMYFCNLCSGDDNSRCITMRYQCTATK